MLPQPEEFKLGKNHPPFLKGGQGGFNKRLIIPLNSPLKRGNLKLPFPSLHRLRENLFSVRQVLQQVPRTLSLGWRGLRPALGCFSRLYGRAQSSGPLAPGLGLVAPGLVPRCVISIEKPSGHNVNKKPRLGVLPANSPRRPRLQASPFILSDRRVGRNLWDRETARPGPQGTILIFGKNSENWARDFDRSADTRYRLAGGWRTARTRRASSMGLKGFWRKATEKSATPCWTRASSV